MKLWLARHAAPLGMGGICYGRSDIAVDPQGTLAAAQRLASELPQGIAVLCSPLRRCRELARELGALRADLVAAEDARIAEMDFGTWEGQRWDTIGEAALRGWMADFGEHRVGGGESVGQFVARVGQAFDAARERGTDTLWVTHAGVIRAASVLASGRRAIANAREWPRAEIAFGSVQVLELD